MWSVSSSSFRMTERAPYPLQTEKHTSLKTYFGSMACRGDGDETALEDDAGQAAFGWRCEKPSSRIDNDGATALTADPSPVSVGYDTRLDSTTNTSWKEDEFASSSYKLAVTIVVSSRGKNRQGVTCNQLPSHRLAVSQGLAVRQ